MSTIKPKTLAFSLAASVAAMGSLLPASINAAEINNLPVESIRLTGSLVRVSLSGASGAEPINCLDDTDSSQGLIIDLVNDPGGNIFYSALLTASATGEAVSVTYDNAVAGQCVMTKIILH